MGKNILATVFGLLYFAWMGCFAQPASDTNAQYDLIQRKIAAHGVRPDALKPLKVQLAWAHQSQFAGVYMALERRHFEEAGLQVFLQEGGPANNPIAALQKGEADVAISWLNNAWHLSTPDNEVRNIGQIFSNASLMLVCRRSAGVYSPKDLAGKRIGVWNVGDEFMVRDMLRRLSIPAKEIELVAQRPDGLDFTEGLLPCVTAMRYNEYIKILESGTSNQDILTITPASLGLSHIEDGVYVRAERLESPEFRAQLVGFMEALRQGWQDSKTAPALALEAVLRIQPALHAQHQRQMLDSVLLSIPKYEEFGYLNLKHYDTVRKAMRQETARPNATLAQLGDFADAGKDPHVWTHKIWNELRKREGASETFSTATRYHLMRMVELPAFTLFITLGIIAFTLSGLMEALKRNYNFWGQLTLALLCGLAGGTIRDFLIGGERMPPFYLKAPSILAYILVLITLFFTLTKIKPDIRHRTAFNNTHTYADIIGFSVLSLTGASIAIASGMDWIWIPICAALSCAGGGMLRDIIINREPATFKGLIYEEIAILGALIYFLSLKATEQLFTEHSIWPIYASLTLGLLSIILLRTLVYRYDIRYPSFVKTDPEQATQTQTPTAAPNKPAAAAAQQTTTTDLDHIATVVPLHTAQRR